jgi:hypothetical protein
VNEIFPLLDPGLSEAVAKSAHLNSFHSPDLSRIKTREAIQLFAAENSTSQMIQEYFERPMNMPFVPSAAVLKKLICKAASIKTEYEVMYTINPKERKRKHNE